MPVVNFLLSNKRNYCTLFWDWDCLYSVHVDILCTSVCSFWNMNPWDGVWIAQHFEQHFACCVTLLKLFVCHLFWDFWKEQRTKSNDLCHVVHVPMSRIINRRYLSFLTLQTWPRSCHVRDLTFSSRQTYRGSQGRESRLFVFSKNTKIELKTVLKDAQKH